MVVCLCAVHVLCVHMAQSKTLLEGPSSGSSAGGAGGAVAGGAGDGAGDGTGDGDVEMTGADEGGGVDEDATAEEQLMPLQKVPRVPPRRVHPLVVPRCVCVCVCAVFAAC